MTKPRTPDEYLGYDPDLVGAIDRAPDGSALRRRPSEEPSDPEYEKEKERLRKWQVITVPPGFLEEALAARKAQREAGETGDRAESDEPMPSSGTEARVPRASAELGGIRSVERPENEPRSGRAFERSVSVVAPREAHDSVTGAARIEWTLSPDLATEPASIPTRPGVPVALAAARNAAGNEEPLVVPMRSVNRAYKVVLALILIATVGGLVALSTGLQPRHASPTEQAGAGQEPPAAGVGEVRAPQQRPESTGSAAASPVPPAPPGSSAAATERGAAPTPSQPSEPFAAPREAERREPAPPTRASEQPERPAPGSTRASRSSTPSSPPIPASRPAQHRPAAASAEPSAPRAPSTPRSEPAPQNQRRTIWK